MPDLNSNRSHFTSYMEEWLNPDVWHKIVTGAGSMIIDIDQRRGKDGLISRIENGNESSNTIYIDINGVTTIRDFIERFLTAYLQNPDAGLHVISKILVEAFSGFNPTIGLNPFTEKASIYFPQSETDVKVLSASFIKALQLINSHWQKELVYFFDNTVQLFEVMDNFSSTFFKKFIEHLKNSYRVIFLVEDEGDLALLNATIKIKKSNCLSSPPPEPRALLGYFANFWDFAPDSMPYKNLQGILSLIDNDPVVAWHLSNQLYLQKLEKEITYNDFKEQLDLLLGLNKGLYRNIYNSLTNYQKRILKALAITDGKKITSQSVRNKFELNTSPYVIQGLEFLRKKKLIRKYGKEHLFVDPLFRIWVLKYF